MDHKHFEIPFNFYPTNTDILSSVLNPPYRFIFENNDFIPNENKTLNEFKKVIENKNYDLNYWNDANLLRFLQGSAFNFAETINNIENHNTWRESNQKPLPVLLNENKILMVA